MTNTIEELSKINVDKTASANDKLIARMLVVMREMSNEATSKGLPCPFCDCKK